MKRRQFIKLTSALAGFSVLQSACKKPRIINGRIIGASSNIGHLLHNKINAQATKKQNTDIVIIGGGVSGLSAARWLKKNNINNFILFDLEDKVGGNATSGSNQYSSFPWGAHYVPIPNNNLTDYLDLLKETGTITGFENNLPIYNEEHLCSDPQERLFINGVWQDGLVPNFGLSENDKKDVEKFFVLMHQFRESVGADKKQAFAIPVDESSIDNNFLLLDKITMKEWLVGKKLTSKYLHSYVNYCTRDDFGTNYNEISAWFGIHYFAARKGKAANAASSDVLTWPQGNGFLVNHLEKEIKGNILTNHLVTDVKFNKDDIVLKIFDAKNKEYLDCTTKHCIVATPQFVNKRLFPFATNRNNLIQDNLKYTPWLVANLTVSKLTEKNGAGFSWDNVIHDSDSLGYVVATHQLVNQNKQINNITYYLPLTQKNAKEARQEASSKTIVDWQNIVFNDLEKVHENIREATMHFDVMIWGHAMAKPLPGVILNNYRKELQKSINNKVHFAHTDLAGISIFEEAFYQGINAAKKVLQNV